MTAQTPAGTTVRTVRVGRRRLRASAPFRVLRAPAGSLRESVDLTAVHPLERAEVQAYWDYHARRFELLRDTIVRHTAATARILDVGPNLQTALLRRVLPNATIDTMGFAHPLVPPREHEVHRELDLNHAVWDASGDARYDLVALAEVIEHLHVPGELVLRYLATWLRPGGVLVVQTPNAVALHKRLRMLVGISPFEPIRVARENPGHVHEYTVPELDEAARRAGLHPAGAISANYFGGHTALSRAYAGLGRILPPTFRHGITVWYARPVTGEP
jgi:SAM-dependent methyltransferase